MREDRKPRQTTEVGPEGNRTRERPRKTCMDDIE